MRKDPAKKRVIGKLRVVNAEIDDMPREKEKRKDI